MNFGFTPIEELRAQGLKTLAYCKAKGYPLQDFNIIYFEGLNTDLKTVNSDRLNEWNDVRAIITSSGDVLMACEATSEPGARYTYAPLNSRGAARIAIGYHKNAWSFGDHKGQDALVQSGPIKVCRDFNQDGSRQGDKVTVESDMGLNQHTTRGNPSEVGPWSAGCLVGRYSSTHETFMKMCRASGLSNFSTIVIDGSDFA